MSLKTPIRPDVTTVIDRLRDEPREPRQKCHSIRPDGSAYCGAWGPTADGSAGRSGAHSNRECRAAGHRHCVLCTELVRQLGGDGVVRA